MAKIARSGIWVWKRISDATTLGGLFPKLAAAVIGCAVAVTAFLQQMPWFLSLGFGLCLFLLSYLAIDAVKRALAAKAAVSPICIGDTLYVDCDVVTDPIGVAKVEGVYSVALCLEVSNQSKDGRTLRDLVAMLNSGAVLPSRLHIRESANDTVNLRHGETAFVEVGRVLVSAQPGSAPAMPRPSGRQPVPLEIINYVMNPNAPTRSLAVGGSNPVGFASHKAPPPTYLPVVISAADTLAKNVLLEMDLWAGNPHLWLKQVKEKARK